MLKRICVLVALLVAAGGGGYTVWAARRAEPPMQAATGMIAAGNLFGAQAVLRGVVKAHPRDIEAHTALAQTLLATADWLSVEREAKTLRALGVARTTVAPMLVRSYANQKRYGDILLEVPAVASRPEEQAMNLALRSVGFMGLGQLPQAQAALDAAAALAPDDFLVRLQKARLALARHDGPGAMREVDAALATEPASTEALWARSEAFRLEWDLTQAIGELDKAVAAAPLSQDLRMARAGLLLSAGWDKQALDDVRAVFEITPSNLTALFYHSLLMMRAGRVVDAGVEFDKLGPSIDQFPKAHFYKAQIALAQGNRQSALESLGAVPALGARGRGGAAAGGASRDGVGAARTRSDFAVRPAGKGRRVRRPRRPRPVRDGAHDRRGGQLSPGNGAGAGQPGVRIASGRGADRFRRRTGR